MTEKSGQDNGETLSSVLDLSDLQGLNIGPNWSDPTFKEKKPKVEGYSDSGKSGRRGGGGPRRDRRPAGMGKDRPRRDFGERGGDRGNRDGGRHGRRDRDSRDRDHARGPFKPSVEATFYAEDAPFRALAQAMRQTNRTYELFEVAQAILQKPERFVIVVKPKGGEGKSANATSGEEQGHKFWISVPDGLPFESEDEAINHVFANHLDKFFNSEEVEVEAPKGAFQVISKCGVTGELLGPPNFHRYQELLREHYAQRINRMSFEEFQKRLESVRDEETVNTWLEKMTKQKRYIQKDAAEGKEPQVFESAESAKHHLLRLHKDKVVHHAASARFSGSVLSQLPQGSGIRRSVDYLLEGQRRFPLDTANHLRGRLRRMNFTVYKRGSKGVSFVCAVKRKFRTPDQRFAEPVQQIIDFIEKNPEVKVADLPEKLYGITIPARKETAEAKPAEETAEAPKAEEAATPENQEAPAVETAEDSPAPEASEQTEAPAPVAEPALNEEQTKQIADFKQNLHWLVSEGYVVEFGDGKLFAPVPREEPKPKEVKAKEPKPAETEAKADDSATAKEPESKEATASVEQPATEETPAAEETPVSEEAPAVEESPAKVETPSAEVVAQEATTEEIAEVTTEAEEPAKKEPEAKQEDEPVAEAPAVSDSAPEEETEEEKKSTGA